MKNNAQKRESVQLDTERENAERTSLSSSRDQSPDMFNPLSMSKSERDGEATTTHGLEMRQANEPDGPELCVDTLPTTAPLAGILLPSDTTLTETPSTTSRQTSPSSAAVATCSTMEGSKPSQSWHESISQRLYETAGVRPYYSDDNCLIIHGDCREILPLLEPGSIDLVLTDPPYIGREDLFATDAVMDVLPGCLCCIPACEEGRGGSAAVPTEQNVAATDTDLPDL